MSAGAPKLAVAVLISGSGTNLQAILDHVARPAALFDVTVVASNRADAGGLERARCAGVATVVVDHCAYACREDFERALHQALLPYQPGLVVLAGFMRVLTAEFVRSFAGRLINIHPSLLPDFKGLHTHQRALDAGVAEHGATVHFVVPDLDAGSAIAQVKVPVYAHDDAQSLAARVLAQEHLLYPLVIRWFAEHRLALRGSQVFFDGLPLAAPVSFHALDVRTEPVQ